MGYEADKVIFCGEIMAALTNRCSTWNREIVELEPSHLLENRLSRVMWNGGFRYTVD